MGLYTTFRLAREANACADRYKHFAKAVGGIKKYGEDTPITIARVLEVNGLDDAIWCLRAVHPDQAEYRDRVARLYACDCAEHVLHVYEQRYPDDKRPRQAIETARRYAQGMATEDSLLVLQMRSWQRPGGRPGGQPGGRSVSGRKRGSDIICSSRPKP